MAVYLVLANQTLGGEQLTDHLDSLVAAGDCRLRFVVPVTDAEGTQQWDYPPIDRVVPDAHRIAQVLAEARLEHELARLSRVGVAASGEVITTGAVEWVRRLLSESDYDGVVVSTLPRRLSRWMIADLPHRVARHSPVPVVHIEGQAGPSL